MPDSRLTGPREAVTLETFVYIPMRDGTQLAADIYRPTRPGTFPALLFRTPYGRNLPVLTDRLRSLASHGYVVIANDARGTGNSEGVYDWYNYVHGPWDGYDCVEWAAAQPWCDGNVGIFGGSAPGVYCWHAAIKHPPHLKALFISTGAGTDAYIDQWYIGGLFQAKNRLFWQHLPKLGLPAFPLPGERAAAQCYQVYLQRFAEMERRLQAGKSPINYDWLIEARANPLDGPYWREKSAYPHLKEITVPVYSVDHWGSSHFVTGTLRGFQETRGPKKLALFPIEFVDHATVISVGLGFPHNNRVDLEAMQVRWFDHWLKGIQNGIMDEPPILLHTSGSDAWRQEQEWPLKRTHQQKWLPGRGALVPPGPVVASQRGNPQSAANVNETQSTFVHDPAAPVLAPLDPADRRPPESHSLTFSTPVLERDLTLTGPLTLKLFASSTAVDADFVVNVSDVHQDGRSQGLTFGALKASHRTSHERPTPLTPGEVYEFTIDIWPISHTFKAGHRLRMAVAGSDYPTFEVNPHKGRTTLLHDAAHPSHVVLPVLPA